MPVSGRCLSKLGRAPGIQPRRDQSARVVAGRWLGAALLRLALGGRRCRGHHHARRSQHTLMELVALLDDLQLLQTPEKHDDSRLMLHFQSPQSPWIDTSPTRARCSWPTSAHYPQTNSQQATYFSKFHCLFSLSPWLSPYPYTRLGASETHPSSHRPSEETLYSAVSSAAKSTKRLTVRVMAIPGLMQKHRRLTMPETAARTD